MICNWLDRSELEEPERVEDLRDSLVDGLRYYSRKRRPDSPQVFPNLLMKISDLRSVGTKGKLDNE